MHDELARAGGPLLLEVLDDLDKHLSTAETQDDSLATYAHKIEKSEAEINWQGDAVTLHRQIRAFNPFPVCWSTIDGQRLKAWEATLTDADGTPGEILAADESGLLIACGEGALRIGRLQLPGGKAMASPELLRSRRELFAPGKLLGR